MAPPPVIFTGPPPLLNDVWRRTVLMVSVVLTAVLAVTLLWRTTNWPGLAIARSLVLGFGIAFGARYGAHGRVRGQMTFQIVIGAISAALFWALYVSSGL